MRYQVATQSDSRGWVDPVPDPILPETFLAFPNYSMLGEEYNARSSKMKNYNEILN